MILDLRCHVLGILVELVFSDALVSVSLSADEVKCFLVLTTLARRSRSDGVAVGVSVFGVAVGADVVGVGVGVGIVGVVGVGIGVEQDGSALLRMSSVCCVPNALKDMVFECSLFVNASLGTRAMSGICDDLTGCT